MRIIARFTLTALVFLLTACSSLSPTTTDLASTDALINQPLHEVDYDSDNRGVQWVSDTVEPHYYKALFIPKVELKQDLTQDKQIPKQVLEQLTNEITAHLQQDISSSMRLADKAGPHVAQVNIRVSRATTEPEDLKLTEVIPLGAVIGSVKMALGTRDKSVRIIIETQIVDSLTSKPVAERVSVIKAAGVLENSGSHLNYEQIRKNVDSFVQETRRFIHAAAKDNNSV